MNVITISYIIYIYFVVICQDMEYDLDINVEWRYINIITILYIILYFFWL